MRLLFLIVSLAMLSVRANTIDVCRVVEELLTAEKLNDELRFESKLIGTCNAIIYQNKVLEDHFEYSSIGHHDCGNWRLGIFSFEQMFSEDVHKALRIDKITQRRNSVDVTYSIITFSIKANKGFSENILFTKRIKLKLGN
jgi:hypothetical protein